MKLTIRLKGGPGSGHTGHAGRPGSVGGSVPGVGSFVMGSRVDTIPVKTTTGVAYVDRGIAPLVEKMNAARLGTGQSCSGHVCDRAVETYISFSHGWRSKSKQALEAVKSIIRSGKLEQKWTFIDRTENQHEFWLTDGFFGTGMLKSTRTVMLSVKRDLQAITAAID